MIRNILILGNGFDLYHKLPTRYSDFMFFASEWETFYLEYENNLGKDEEFTHISVPLTENGELSQEALIEFGRHPSLMNKEHIEFLRDNLKTNCWIRYFHNLQMKGLRWIDFETEIQNVLYDTEEYSMQAIPQNVGKKCDEGLPDRLKNIPCFFGAFARNGYLNFGNARVLKEFTDIKELQKNKLKLIEFMVEEQDKLIKCLQFYLDDFVGVMKCDIYSEQIRSLGEVNVLNFNYTNTFKNIYGEKFPGQFYNIHGGTDKGDIVLGISDDAFPDTHDYIRFQKFFQRIQKRTGSSYRKWISFGHVKNGVIDIINVFIMGHSLGLADFGVLKEFFENPGVSKVTVFYHSQNSYEELVINLVKALGKEEAIEKIGTEKIVFQKLKNPVAFS